MSAIYFALFKKRIFYKFKQTTDFFLTIYTFKLLIISLFMPKLDCFKSPISVVFLPGIPTFPFTTLFKIRKFKQKKQKPFFFFVL